MNRTRSVSKSTLKAFTGRVGGFLYSLQTEPPVNYRLEPGKPVPISPVIPRRGKSGFTHVLVQNRPIVEEPPRFPGYTLHSRELCTGGLFNVLHHIFGQILPAHPVRGIGSVLPAPGGKSTLIASGLSSGSTLVANEVIRSGRYF